MMLTIGLAELKGLVRSYPDFPKPGVLFRDIMPVLANPGAIRRIVDAFMLSVNPPEVLVGVESRGFILAAALAASWGVSFVSVRKPGRLPGSVIHQDYALEYGEGALQMQAGMIQTGQRVVIVDDLLATGGTANATVKLVERSGATVEALLFLIELEGLGGRTMLTGHQVHALMSFPAS